MFRLARRCAGSISILSLLITTSAVLLITLDRSGAADLHANSRPAQSTVTDDEKAARAACTPCHKFPTPDILPRSKWHHEIAKMMYLRDKKSQPRGDLSSVELSPDMAAALRYMEANAPERLEAPKPWPAVSESPLKFTSYGLNVPDAPDNPAVSNVQLADFDGDGKLDVIGTEMFQGTVFWGHLEPQSALKVIADIPHPDHVTFTDVDGDGLKDLLIADLGQFLPGDHTDGAMIWMRALGGGKFGGFWADGLPRVADVEAGDFNGDGKTDLAVAAFGWRTTGHIAILENQSSSSGQPSFTPHIIDPRPGAIHIVPIDLNKDGKLDFIALLSQQYETVVAYINSGKADFSFIPRVLYEAPHPNWGSTGIQVVDLDKDGDPDVLFTHGDTMDDALVKPYHGIQWLENTGGDGSFSAHDVTQMPSVHRAMAADLDGDGDLDIVASALLPGASNADDSTLPALVWLEQTKSGVFVRHTIEMGFPRHATLDVADVDADGDIDIVTGTFSPDKPTKSWVQVWLNPSRAAKK
jgi:VCBS repeat protein